MSVKVDASEYRLDSLKWLLVVGIVLGGTIANAYYSSEFPIFYRAIALVALGLIACFVAVNTAKGNSFWELLKASQVEIRKVVWPTRQETIQTTLIVVAVVIVTAIILWGLDSLLGYLASLIIG